MPLAAVQAPEQEPLPVKGQAQSHVPRTGSPPESVTVPIRLGTLDTIRPGKLKNPDDINEEIEDLGNEIDTEGNSVFGETGAKVSGNWGQMEQSLRGKGFRAEVVERSYMPDYVGMKFHIKTISTGKYKDKNTQEEKDSTALVCDQIHTFPYEAKKSGGKKGGTSAKASTSAPAAAVEDPMAAAVGVFSELSDTFKKAVPSGKQIKRSMFQVQVQLEVGRKKLDNGTKTAILNLIKNDEQLVELANAVGFGVDLDESTVIFP